MIEHLDMNGNELKIGDRVYFTRLSHILLRGKIESIDKDESLKVRTYDGKTYTILARHTLLSKN